VEGPLTVLHLDAMETDAASKQQADPLAAAALFGTVAQGLQEGGFPGHAAAMRHRQAAAAEAGGDQGMAFSILARLSLDAVLAGEPVPLRSAGRKLGELAAADWYEHGSQLPDVAPALRRLACAAGPDTPALTCLLIEQAIADGLFEQVPPGSATALAGAVSQFWSWSFPCFLRSGVQSAGGASGAGVEDEGVVDALFWGAGLGSEGGG
jgi:hypothetical protein